MAYPVFLAGRLLGPNSTIRKRIGELERQLHSELVRPNIGERFKSVLALGAALWTAVTLKLNLFQHPRLTRTEYRVADRRNAFHLWEEIHRKVTFPNLSIQVELQHAKRQVRLRLEGVLSSAESERLGQRIREGLHGLRLGLPRL